MRRIMSRVDDLRRARERMEAVRTEIYAGGSGTPGAGPLGPPTDGGWSAAEVLDHIGTAERTLVKALTKFQKGEPTRVGAPGGFYRLPVAPFFWRIRFKSPKLVRPRPRSELKPGEVLEGLRTSRAGLLAIADRMGEEPFARVVFPHYIFGRFSGLTWFRFIGRHEARHLAQIRRVLAGPKVLRCRPPAA